MVSLFRTIQTEKFLTKQTISKPIKTGSGKVTILMEIYIPKNITNMAKKLVHGKDTTKTEL
jgi:hypothetical protein